MHNIGPMHFNVLVTTYLLVCESYSHCNSSIRQILCNPSSSRLEADNCRSTTFRFLAQCTLALRGFNRSTDRRWQSVPYGTRAEWCKALHGHSASSQRTGIVSYADRFSVLVFFRYFWLLVLCDGTVYGRTLILQRFSRSFWHSDTISRLDSCAKIFTWRRRRLDLLFIDDLGTVECWLQPELPGTVRHSSYKQ